MFHYRNFLAIDYRVLSQISLEVLWRKIQNYKFQNTSSPKRFEYEVIKLSNELALGDRPFNERAPGDLDDGRAAAKMLAGQGKLPARRARR